MDIMQYKPKGKLNNKHLLTLKDYTANEIYEILLKAAELKNMNRRGKKQHNLDGKTVALMKKRFLSQGANSVKLCSMLARKEGVADYIGFVFDTDKFFIGYGLDYNQSYRNMDGVYELIP